MNRAVCSLSAASLLALGLGPFSACSSSSSPAKAPTADACAGTCGAGDDVDASPDAEADADSNPDASLDDAPIPPAFQAFATAFDAERAKLGASGAAVAILQNGQVAFAHGFGVKGPNSADPVRARTLFRIGSMTKALTATTLMTLAQEGKVDPAATLTSVVPDVALNTGTCSTCASTLTLQWLLSHQSGLDDYIVLDGPTDDAELSTFLTSAAFASADYFMDPSGSFWNYANPNFYLVGLTAERLAGVPYRQAVQQRVLTPLGMTRTFFLPSDVMADGDFTDGSSTDTSGNPWDVTPSSYDNGWARPAGYAFSSVIDYARFVQFLNAGQPSVLADAQRQQMMTPAVSLLEVGSYEQYGYGLFIDSAFQVEAGWYPVTLVSHGGDIPGFASDFYLVPSTGFGIVTFANADGAHFETSLALAFQGFAGLPASTSIPASLTVDPTTFPALAGAYYDPNNVGHIVVTVSAGLVSISMPDLDTAKIAYSPTLTPVTPGNFTYTVESEPTVVTFIPDATGASHWFRTRYFVAAAQPPGGIPRPAVKVDPKALRARLRARL